MGTYGIILFRTVFVYLFIIVIFRIMGKREIGELGIVDLVVFVMLAELAVLAIEDYKHSFFLEIFPMLILLTIQVTFSYISLKSRKFRRLIDGEPSIIIKDGKINEKAMRKQRYNFDDLLMQLREKDIRDIADVEFALLEPTGKLSVFKKEKNKPNMNFTVPLIMDGKIEYEKLERINKTEKWLLGELKKRGVNRIEQVSFLSYTDGKIYMDIVDEE